MSLTEALDMLKELAREIDDQKMTNALWTAESHEERLWNEKRLRLELRIIHAILEKDEKLEIFREARDLLFFD